MCFVYALRLIYCSKNIPMDVLLVMAEFLDIKNPTALTMPKECQFNFMPLETFEKHRVYENIEHEEHLKNLSD